MHSDTQGNIIAISDANANIINRRSYTPFGEIRHIEYKEGISNALNSLSITNRGYSGHEHIDNTELIHMNGRVYDPTIGRFMSADPFIQAPTDTQSYNRYSYVRNNPINLTDPSGYNWISDRWHSAVNHVKDNGWEYLKYGIFGNPMIQNAIAGSSILQTAGYIVASLAGPAGTGLWSAYITDASGGSVSDVVRSGVISAGSAWIASGIGDTFGHDSSFLTASSASEYAQAATKAIAHGTSQGAIAELRGGSFQDSFVSGFVSSGFSIGNKGYGNTMSRTAIMAVVGGTVSRLGGGKFANGAVTAAFVHMFNSEGGNKQKKGTPKNNQAQNKQFKSATKGLNKSQKRTIHEMISGENYSYHEIKDLARSLFNKGLLIVIPLTSEQIREYQLCGIDGCEL